MLESVVDRCGSENRRCVGIERVSKKRRNRLVIRLEYG